MCCNWFIRILLATLCCLGIAGNASAQYSMYTPKPVSNVGGPTGQNLNQIYQSGVGQGFTGSSLNLLSLQYSKAQTPYVGQSSTQRSAIGAGQPLGLGGSAADKPFSSYSPGPTTSPYLNLFREDLSGSDDLNYNTLVRPQLQQQQFNEQSQRQALELNRRMQTLSAQADFNVQGDKNEFPTGHKTLYHNYLHYYQMPQGKARKPR
jgi:hypothetical protein